MDETETITLGEFLDAYEELSDMQLWDFLVYNGYIEPAKDEGF